MATFHLSDAWEHYCQLAALKIGPKAVGDFGTTWLITASARTHDSASNLHGYKNFAFVEECCLSIRRMRL